MKKLLKLFSPVDGAAGATSEVSLTALAGALVSGEPTPATQGPTELEKALCEAAKAEAPRKNGRRVKVPFAGKEPRKEPNVSREASLDDADIPGFLDAKKNGLPRGKNAPPAPKAFAEAAAKEKKTVTTTKGAKAPKKGKGRKSQADVIAALLTRASGCTAKDILKATGWKAVNVPRQAKISGLKLKQKREDGVTRYWGTGKA